jgi:hypothetical protein
VKDKDGATIFSLTYESERNGRKIAVYLCQIGMGERLFAYRHEPDGDGHKIALYLFQIGMGERFFRIGTGVSPIGIDIRLLFTCAR